MHPKDADGMANSADPDQTAPSSSLIWVSLFVETCLAENLGSLRYLFRTWLFHWLEWLTVDGHTRSIYCPTVVVTLFWQADRVQRAVRAGP